jgi:hypothetical protein
LIVALVLFWRHGGYLVVRKSRSTWVPHFMWARSIEGIRVIEYKPRKPLQGRWARLVPLHVLLFRGRLRRGHGEETQ